MKSTYVARAHPARHQATGDLISVGQQNTCVYRYFLHVTILDVMTWYRTELWQRIHKNYMAMKSTWNRTCFLNPPGCCMYRLPYEQVGPDIKGSRWVAFLLSVSWNWHLHTASGQRVLILYISHSRGDRYRQYLCLEQSKIHQTSSGRVVREYSLYKM